MVAPEEVREKIREDVNSGYSALEEEMPEIESDVFGEGNGTESLNELVQDPNITASEAATLNGVQVTSMVNIASQVAKNELSRESAIAILQKSFNMSEQEAEAIIGNEKLEQPSVNDKISGVETQDSWNESDHPRDKNGQFSENSGSNSSMKKEETKQITVNGNELGENLSGQALRDKAKEYYIKHLADKKCKNEKLGEILFSHGGFNKPISSSKDERKLKLIPFLPDIISKGTAGNLEPDKKQRKNVKGFYTIKNAINFQGQECKIRVSIREDNNGKLYYDHSFIKEMSKGEDSINNYELNLEIE